MAAAALTVAMSVGQKFASYGEFKEFLKNFEDSTFYFDPDFCLECRNTAFSCSLCCKTHAPEEVHHFESKLISSLMACDHDIGYSSVYLDMKYNSNVKDRTDHIQTKYKIKEIQIKCCDIFQTNIEELFELLSQNGITKMCIDSLSEKEFIALAVQYKHTVSFIEKKEDIRTAVKLKSYTENDIRHLILDGNKPKHGTCIRDYSKCGYNLPKYNDA